MPSITHNFQSRRWLSEFSPYGAVLSQVPLAEKSRWKIGGMADCVVLPESAEALSGLVKRLTALGLPYVALGSSANLLFADEGLRAVAIVLGNQMSRLEIQGTQVWAQAGVWVPRLAKRVADAGLAGAEHMAGIPGTLGGLICMNGGSQRQGVGDRLVHLRSVSPEGELVKWTRDQCDFAYRSSRFQTNGHIIADAAFEYEWAEDRSEVRRAMLRILRSRRAKFPQKLPNCGSVFVSDPALYADFGPPGAIIERFGFKGLRQGQAQVSPLHANFIVNTGGATAEDVLRLIHQIQSKIEAETGVRMRAEARFVRQDGVIVPADEEARRRYAES